MNIQINDTDLRGKVELTLHRLQISGSLRGYRYLVDAIVATAKDPDSTVLITKCLYPDIAKKYHTTRECVERSIRHAIARVWELSGASDLESITQVYLRQKPSNTQFIDLIASTIRYSA